MIRKNGYKDFIQSADDTLVQKRVIKTPEEIIKVEYATRVTNEIYDALLLFAKPGMYEYEIEAFIKSQFIIRSGVEFFETIVASGVNACTLHYIANNRKIEAGDIVLIDFGIEIDGYGADISRTFPISGEFTPRQKELYDGVLATKKYAESILKSGISILEMNRQIHHFMIHELFPEIGLQVSTSSVKLNNPFMPHSIGHFLGIDVHDVGDRDGALELGMVVTIEPGIYVKEEGIGIRIEDDYLVTEDGCRRL